MHTTSDTELLQSSILRKEYGLLVGDRASLPMHPAIAAGNIGIGNESQTVVATLASIGTDVAATISETGAVVPTDHTLAQVSATVVRKSIGRSRSDIVKFYDQTGLLKDPAAMAFDAVSVRNNTILSMVASAAATGTVDVTPGSGVGLTWAKFMEAKQTMTQAGVDFMDGELLAILHPKQWSNLESQIAVGTSLSAAVIEAPEGFNIQLAKKIGYQGRYFGIDIFTTTRVPTANAGADSRGALIAPGGIVWAEGLIEPDPDGFMDILDGGRLQIERQRDASRMTKAAYYNFLVGVSLGENARVVTITSDR